MRQGATPEESVTVIRRILESQPLKYTKLQEEIKKAVGEKGDISAILPKMMVDVLDLDNLRSEEDVPEAEN